MLLIASQIVNLPILSLRDGGKLGVISGILIDHNRLSVKAFWARVYSDPKKIYLLTSDSVLSLSHKGAIVQNHESLDLKQDLPAYKEYFEVDYQIPGKKVIRNNRKLGLADDFVIDARDLKISDIIVRPSTLTLFRVSQNRFSRRQIKEINDTSIIVSDDSGKIKSSSFAPAASLD